MAKRRRVGNLLALAVLSALVQRPMHPYEMAAVLREHGKDQDMPIKWGSLYTVVANLTRHGLLAAVESGRQGRRPERTVYRITDAGREELADWTRELVAVPEREHPRFKAGLSVLGILPPDEVTELLRQRLDRLEAQLAEQRAALARTAREVPRIFLIEVEYDLAVQAAEADWVRGLLDELTTGSLPGLAEWRAWHETGAMPPEWAELAERGTEQQ
ncbi:PadR family transcriptional regulator [Micromonospora eburnea]|uniref:Transcriptional regulator, PadR family n=1 Tax=Micromonospora eburnea TaxID=227316 RepID=A0A1C6VK32_9ACTN|nr:PadR family transcriptional regulator [Micromonospora eburnea]SCL66698.1 transcriptional regulator, PadR family [Micromonospora eburnea]